MRGEKKVPMFDWTLHFVHPARLSPTFFPSEIETIQSPIACQWRVPVAVDSVDTALQNEKI